MGSGEADAGRPVRRMWVVSLLYGCFAPGVHRLGGKVRSQSRSERTGFQRSLQSWPELKHVVAVCWQHKASLPIHVDQLPVTQLALTSSCRIPKAPLPRHDHPAGDSCSTGRNVWQPLLRLIPEIQCMLSETPAVLMLDVNKMKENSCVYGPIAVLRDPNPSKVVCRRRNEIT